MTRVTLTFILSGLLLSLTLALGYLWYSGGQEIAELRQANKELLEASEQANIQREKDRNILVARERQIASQRALLAQAQEGLSQALRANNEWSNTNVPTDVQEALVGLSDGLAGGPPDGLRKPYAGSDGESPATD